jgi:antitoxin (DNA-binding transcriptional repressor) of toxin-antitoxin stability system
MSTHTVAETKNQLSKLIDRALKGEHIVVTRRGHPVIEFKPIQAERKQDDATPALDRRGAARMATCSASWAETPED